jgi:hypothetical protein
MARKTPLLVVASFVLLAAGVAAANGLLAAPPAGLGVNTGTVTAQTTPSTTTPSTVGPSTGTAGPSTGTSGTTGAGTTTGATPGTTTGTPGATTGGTVTAPTTPGAALTIDQVVSITRSVAAGTPVTAFTVPTGQQLVITDVLVTNPGTTPACGAAIGPSGASTPTTGTTTPGTTTPGTTTPSTTTNGTPESGTGLLCVPAQTSLNLGLTTGLEFAPGQSVVLANATTAATGTTTLHYHLRGFLMSSGA